MDLRNPRKHGVKEQEEEMLAQTRGTLQVLRTRSENLERGEPGSAPQIYQAIRKTSNRGTWVILATVPGHWVSGFTKYSSIFGTLNV